MKGAFGEAQTYADLKKHLEELDKERGNVIPPPLTTFAVPPSEFGTIVKCLRRKAGFVSDAATEKAGGLVDPRHHREAVRPRSRELDRAE